MSDHSSEPSRVIYIGSIPYDQTEDQILEIARSVGPVRNSKLLFDKETGKSKGYAFVEFADIETASSAVRNLNNYSIGNRFLKCNFASEQSLLNLNNNNNNNNNNSNNNSHNHNGNHHHGGMNGGGYDLGARSRERQLEANIPPLPLGIEVSNPSNETLSNVITGALNNLHETRLLNLLKDAQKMSKESPESMTILLRKNPQLTFALIQACLVSGKVKPDDIKELVNRDQLDLQEQQQPSQEKARGDEAIEEQEQDQENQQGNEQGQGQSTIGNELSALSEDQLQAIKTIVLMSEEDIESSIPAEQRPLYQEIRQKYQGYF